MMSKLLQAIWRKIVFFVGDVHHVPTFPWVSWGIKKHNMGYDEILEALPIIQYGDIGLHRDNGFLSNIAIPGFMKHGWIYVQDGLEKPSIVEAISQGVIERNSIYPTYSDYTIIVRPLHVSEEERKGACRKAEAIVGEQYDVNFAFDIEKELTYYQGLKVDDASQDLLEAQVGLREYSPAFSCTEVCSYAWWHKRELLRLYRSERRGKHCIIADDFLNGSWEIVWMSQSVTLDSAKKLGLHEEGLSMVAAYLKKT
jgi:hypothetical protein